MGSKGGFEMPMPNTPAYPFPPQEGQYNLQSLPQYGAPPLSPYSTPPPPYQNTFPGAIPQMPPYEPPPPYSPLYSNGSVPPQTLYPHFSSQQPSLEDQHPYQQHYIPPNQNQQDLCANPPSPLWSVSPGYTPSCPPVIHDTPPASPQGRPQAENLRRGPSIGFGDINDNHSTGSLYPSLPSDFQNSDRPPSNQNATQGPTPLPPNLVHLWEGSKPVKIFFVQEEGHVVSPDRSLNFCIYKCPPMNDVSSFPVGSLAGKAYDATVIMKAEETWRLGLAKHRSFIIKGMQGELVFYDDSTTPKRTVVVILPKEMSSDEKQRLNVLVKASSFMIDEPSSIVDKLDSGVESVYGYLTESVNSVVKKGTPDLHKNTKWLRKGTGQVVRLGGSLVSKGIHLVSDTVVEKDTPKVLSNQHSQLIEGLKMYRDAVTKKTVAQVSVVH